MGVLRTVVALAPYVPCHATPPPPDSHTHVTVHTREPHTHTHISPHTHTHTHTLGRATLFSDTHTQSYVFLVLSNTQSPTWKSDR